MSASGWRRTAGRQNQRAAGALARHSAGRPERTRRLTSPGRSLVQSAAIWIGRRWCLVVTPRGDDDFQRLPPFAEQMADLASNTSTGW
jgi:hypothetical protein